MPARIIARVLSLLPCLLLVGFVGLAALGAEGQPAPLVSPEVYSDHSVTFRFPDPNAQKVELQLEGRTQHLVMQKDAAGVWSVTTDPLPPDYYGYSFIADGVALIDPANTLMKPNLLNTQSMVHVPGPASLPWEVNDVPHGVIHHHLYRSRTVGEQRDYFVYTPPGYDAAAKTRYPVLYLLHGYSDDASAWAAVGRANVILDNLMAERKAKPMIVVMPLGYGAPELLARGSRGLQNQELRQNNLAKFREALLNEVMPRTEQEYRCAQDPRERAIAGLSMGGAESLFVGLTSADRFAWIGAFSSGGLSDDFDRQFSGMKAKELSRLNLVWISCGTDDNLIVENRNLREWLTRRGVKHTDVDTPGGHTWMVWRRNLATLVPLLFQGQ